jgi:hypothetical protein
MQYNVIYQLHYKILKLRGTKANRHDLFQNNLVIL